MFNPIASFDALMINTVGPAIVTALSLAVLNVHSQPYETKELPCIDIQWLAEGGHDEPSGRNTAIVQLDVWVNQYDQEKSRKIREQVLNQLGFKRGENGHHRAYVRLKDYKTNESSPPDREQMELRYLGAEGWRCIPDADPTVLRHMLTLQLLFERANA